MKTPHFSIQDFHWRDQEGEATKDALKVLNKLTKEQASAVRFLADSCYKEGEYEGREDMREEKRECYCSRSYCEKCK